MKNNDLLEVLNIGIPCYLPIDIKLQKLTSMCSDNMRDSINEELKIYGEAKRRIEDITDIHVNENFSNPLMYLSFNCNEEDSKSNIYTDNRIIINNLFYDLVKTPSGCEINKEELKEKLNYLYDKVKYIFCHPYTTKFHNDLKENLNRLYYNRTYGDDLRYFLKNSYKYYTSFINLETKQQIIDTEDLIEDYIKKLNPYKTADYVAHSYLLKAQELLKNQDLENVQNYLFFISSYLKNRKSSNESYYSHIKNEFQILLRQYDFLQNTSRWNRNLFINKDYDTNMIVINNILNIQKGKVNETILKPGSQPITKTNQGIKHEIHEPTLEELKEIEENITNKLYFYYSLDPIEEINGKNALSNYKCFLYNNGIIIADRINNINTINQLKSDAIYVFDANNFESAIHLNKQELKKILSTHNHSKTWQDKVINHVNEATTDELKEQAKTLSLKLKK